MTVDDIFRETQGAYLCLVHPVLMGDAYRRELAPIVAIAPSVPDGLVSGMITGPDWRLRLVGICLAASKKSTSFAESMVQSLREPHGIAIVPACAAIAVFGSRGIYQVTKSFGQDFNRTAFDGEVGWVVDKARHFVGLLNDDVPGVGPNYGQRFEDHVEIYNWLSAA